MHKVFISGLPKVELHLHIEGSLEPELMFKLAKRNNVDIPFNSPEEVAQAYKFDSLQSFLDIYYQGANVLIHEQDFFDLTWEYLLRCKQDNVIHTEIFFDPQTHTDRGIAFDTVINGIDKALKQAKQQLNISSHLIMSFLRHLDEDSAFNTLEQAKPYQDKIIAVGLDSSELGNPPEKFERIFQQAIKQGYLTVAHAGEEGPASYISDALNLLSISRIDHGVRCIDDKTLLDKLISQQIPLTVCPLSNVKLCVFNDMTQHNIVELLRMGVCVTINSDDPAYFGGYMTSNFLSLAQAHEMNLKEIAQFTYNAIQASFINDAEKARLNKTTYEYVSRFID
ncbi:adenosine deaminase [Pseudoalteromonas sp. NBT06-2]|uniref:adenosine deaminase n=1 Tax=Pseudoalteromonas sp. NBT06-2 TaxID=2025950 RepID=UPI000BA64261|nr:adenosine deaminase [Pseudoalteromonas sp. NBT06-2]PAJ75507.1 adenosine deaminase [Pseudoalteromonas sp. NBT06-2]